MDSSLVTRHSRNQPVHRDLLGLAHTMRSVHRLRVVARVPIVVVCAGASACVRDATLNSLPESLDSQKITVSAAVRLIPRPPALVDRQKTKISGLHNGVSWDQSQVTSQVRRDLLIVALTLSASWSPYLSCPRWPKTHRAGDTCTADRSSTPRPDPSSSSSGSRAALCVPHP